MENIVENQRGVSRVYNIDLYEETTPVDRDGIVVIGIDAEWVEVGDQGAETPKRRNKVLSYQWAVYANGKRWSGIFYPENGKRITLHEWIARALADGIDKGHIEQYPEDVTLVAHETKAEVRVSRDFALLKKKLSHVQKSFVRTHQPLKLKRKWRGNSRTFNVLLYDSKLLSPAGGKTLAAVGKLIGAEKIEPGEKVIPDRFDPDAAPFTIPYITRMDLLLKDDPEHFARYAVKDAEITRDFIVQMYNLVRGELGLDRLPPTLSGVTVDRLRLKWQLLDVDENAVLGWREETYRKHIGDGWPKKVITVTERVRVDGYADYENLIIDCYHGGHTEAFMFGVLDNGPWHDYDLKSAYATALASIGMPDWDAAYASTDPEDFKADTMGFARVDFEFPPEARYPFLPVRDMDDRLIFPRKGSANVGAPEIDSAIAAGAKVKIKRGVVIPYKRGRPPFEDHLREVREKKESYRDSDHKFEYGLWKLLGNGVYGKLAQGLKDRRVYNPKTGTSQTIPESAITNAAFAAHTTSLVRAAIGDLMSGIPQDREVAICATDGILTNADLETLDRSGPSCHEIARTSKSVYGSDEFIEEKRIADNVVVWTGRGYSNLDGLDFSGQGGIKTPRDIAESVPFWKATPDWLVMKFLTRKPGQRYNSDHLTSIRDMCTLDAELVMEHKQSKLSFEPDMKRKLVKATTVETSVKQQSAPGYVSHVLIRTEPWPELSDYMRGRTLMDRWRENHVLRTEDDFASWVEYAGTDRASKRGLRRGADGALGQLRRNTMRAIAKKRFGFKRGPRTLRMLAKEMHSAGCSLGANVDKAVNGLKNAGRAGSSAPLERVIPKDAPGVQEFVEALREVFPGSTPDKMLY